jgi:hypothetical protein
VQAVATAEVLNARRHRSAEQPEALAVLVRDLRVLNARRHRSGEQTSALAFFAAMATWCSTPEGIGAANKASVARALTRGAL